MHEKEPLQLTFLLSRSTINVLSDQEKQRQLCSQDGLFGLVTECSWTSVHTVLNLVLTLGRFFSPLPMKNTLTLKYKNLLHFVPRGHILIPRSYVFIPKMQMYIHSRCWYFSTINMIQKVGRRRAFCSSEDHLGSSRGASKPVYLR